MILSGYTAERPNVASSAAMASALAFAASFAASIHVSVSSRAFALARARVSAAILASSITRCASSSAKLNHISLGMSRDEVVKTLGRPHALSAQGDVEFLTYNLINKGVGDMKEFVIRIQKGSVESFGERGNFDGDGVIDAQEIANSPAALKKLGFACHREVYADDGGTR